MNALDQTFTALGDATRRAILARLARGEASVSELARPFAMSLPAVLKHVDCLERAGLLEGQKDGRVRRCRLRVKALREAGDWIARYRQFWEERFEALDRYLRETTDEEDGWRKRRKDRRRSALPAPSPRRGRRSSGPGSIRRR